MVGLGARFIQWIIFQKSKLVEEDQIHLKLAFVQFIQSVLIPICIYANNPKLFNHVRTEIFA